MENRNTYYVVYQRLKKKVSKIEFDLIDKNLGFKKIRASHDLPISLIGYLTEDYVDRLFERDKDEFDESSSDGSGEDDEDEYQGCYDA